MRNILIVSGIALVVIVGVFIIISHPWQKSPSIQVSSFEECKNAGYPIMESYPEQCRTPDGKTFTENIGNELDKTDLIRVSNPRPNQEIASPLAITSSASSSSIKISPSGVCQQPLSYTLGLGPP